MSGSRIRKGQTVKFKTEAYLKDIEKQKFDSATRRLLMSDPNCPALIIEKRLRKNGHLTAEVIGTHNYGRYANLRLADGFECGCESEFLERI